MFFLVNCLSLQECVTLLRTLWLSTNIQSIFVQYEKQALGGEGL